MESQTLFKKIVFLLLEKNDGILPSVMALGKFNQEDCLELIELIKLIPTVADENGCLIIKKEDLEPLMFLYHWMYLGSQNISNKEVGMQIEKGLTEVINTLNEAVN